MKIYTKTGDKGTTALVGGVRVNKSDARIQAYGNIDELNSWVGLLIAGEIKEKATVDTLQWIQNRLFDVGCLLATPKDSDNAYKPEVPLAKLENEIDRLYEQLPQQTGFILPGGSMLAARVHVARAVCRRAERSIVALAYDCCPRQTEVLAFVNRLSDYLFALARYVNFKENYPEIYWEK